MLQFCLTTSLEVLDAPVSGKSGGVPKSGRSLHTQLVFEVLFVALGSDLHMVFALQNYLLYLFGS